MPDVPPPKHTDECMLEPVIGIDLGTTNSCVAYWEAGDDMVVPNKEGFRTTPSCVAFNDVERLIGQAAKREMTRNPANVVFSVKRLMGRRFDEPEVQSDLSRWPFKVIEDGEGYPKIKAEYKGKEVSFSPEEISAMVLGTLKEAVEARIGVAVRKAVITVPAYFDNAQKQATVDAGEIAGLKVLRIINEPTAAALAYGVGKRDSDREQKVLVFDLGGGTFDVSILSIYKQTFQVKAVGGDTHLGGDDFDNCLMDHCQEDLKQQHNIELDNPVTRNRLRNACREAKEELSSSLKGTIDLPWLSANVTYSTTITRSLFESLCDPLLTKCVAHVKKTLEDAQLSVSELDVVLLVGGSSRIPKLQEMLKDFFQGRNIFRSMNPDEDVAKGAAIQAAMLAGVDVRHLTPITIKDVTPLSLGIGTLGDILSKIIERNSEIPIKKSQTYETTADNQTIVTSVIYEGERPKASRNHLLGMLTINGLDPAPRGKSTVLTTFSLDENGILSVTLSDKQKFNEKKLAIKMNKGRMSREQLEDELRAFDQMKQQDEEWRQAAFSRNQLYFLIQDAKRSTDPNVLSKCEELENWLESHQSAPKEDYDKIIAENTKLKNSP
eukprot:Gregarina_sp_Pseudo_9__3116@NODE_330_length_3140_cov_33_648178_g310_i0_p1_GENE_NODE_330_length_3140_cov_33_648178_g310_i0NODE_330_length_3140_cov_33_648178_g310_i0_p1_ORF_typecomplete_len607_score86_60HSP70/PF00012_20/3e112MreB_Mbl/PF06723_13/2_2e28StbA/PF06406_11/9_9e09PilM_2/PF11104_8/4_1e08Actin/PF00022_19/0_00012FGGY_C/PF02782_16/0_00023FtsA/PF14450_6/5_4e02FtsA/PF14450_6/0_014Hydantoinase_A/PF01968_18/1_9e03Hydantoinase_A/PF01968_18/0_0086Hydantoinase_A/PF01968_18/7_9e02DDR/PF08841_10/0_11D